MHVFIFSNTNPAQRVEKRTRRCFKSCTAVLKSEHAVLDCDHISVCEKLATPKSDRVVFISITTRPYFSTPFLQHSVATTLRAIRIQLAILKTRRYNNMPSYENNNTSYNKTPLKNTLL